MSSRIPAALQAVFVDAWKGNEVNVAPKGGVAFKVFRRPAQPDAAQASRRLNLRWSGGGMLGRKPQNRKNHVEDLANYGHAGRLKIFSKLSKTRSCDTMGTESNDDGDLSSQGPSVRTKRSTKKGNSNESATSVGVPKCLSVFGQPAQKSPQVFLDVMLRSRGYSVKTFRTLDTAYYNSPTSLQTSSYHHRLQALLHSKNEGQLEELLGCGISPNPCNQHGESLLHTAARYGYGKILQIMIDCGATVQVSDDSGRTPLHSAFFGTQPSLETVELILTNDRHLLHLRDHLDFTPLSYIPRNQWGLWIDFFYSKRDEFWPKRHKRLDGVAEPSPKMSQSPHSTPLPDPENALSLEIAEFVGAGRLSPEDAYFLMGDDSESDDETEDDDFLDDMPTEHSCLESESTVVTFTTTAY